MNTRSLLVLCASALVCSAAHADEFSFNASGAGFSASTIITASPTATPGVDQITAISGDIDGARIGGLATGTLSADGTYQYVNYFSLGTYNYGPEFDNLYYTTGAPLDTYGIGITLADGSVANIYEDNGTFYFLYNQNFTPADVNDLTPGETLGTVDVAPVPEPSNLLLLGTGTLALAGPMRRRLVRI